MSEVGGINPIALDFYTDSISFNAERSHFCFISAFKIEPKPENAKAIFELIQEALTHAAAMSRYFWPSRTKGKYTLHKLRGDALRKKFDVSDHSVLKDRKIRDFLEHYDERLDEFLLNDPVGYFFPTPIINSADIANEPIGNIFKLIDPQTYRIVLLNETFELEPIILEVSSILEKLRTAG